MWKRFFALRFTLFAASHNIRFTTKNQPASSRRIHLCPWLQANLSYQSKIEPKQFLTIVLRSRLYLHKQAYMWGRQTSIVLGFMIKLYALYQNGIHKENCLHTIKITRLLFKWKFVNFECWFSRSSHHYSVAKNLYRYNVSPTLKLIESAMKRNVLQKINEWLVNIKII